MGIISIVFLIFGWFYEIKGLVITSLILSSIFVLSFIIGMVFYDERYNYTKETCIINCTIQIIVLIFIYCKTFKRILIMWDYILCGFIILFVVGIFGTLLDLHVKFWIDDVSHPILAFSTLPFFIIFGLIESVIKIIYAIEDWKYNKGR